MTNIYIGTTKLPPNTDLPDNTELRRYRVSEEDANGEKPNILYLNGEKNKAGLGDIRLSFSGRLDNNTVFQDPSGVLACLPDSAVTGTKGPRDAFKLPGSGQSFGFKSITQDTNGQTHVSKVRMAALFNPNKPGTRATYARLCFEDNSFINKIMVPGGDAIEVCKNADNSIRWLQVSLGGNGYQPVKIDPNTDEGKAKFVELLQGGAPSDEANNQNGSFSAEFARLVQKTGLSSRQFLYVLGLVEKSGSPTVTLPTLPPNSEHLDKRPTTKAEEMPVGEDSDTRAPNTGKPSQEQAWRWRQTPKGNDILTIDRPTMKKTPDAIIFNGTPYVRQPVPSQPSNQPEQSAEPEVVEETNP